jgi:hypothetical protein
MTNVINSIDEIKVITVSCGTQVVATNGLVTVVTNSIQGVPGVGLPTGGTTGQVAAKLSDANFDIGWVNGSAKPGSLLSTMIAGQDIAALTVVYDDPITGNVFYADKDNLSTISSILGVGITTVLSGADVDVITSGEVSSPSWSWNMSNDLSLFLGNNGAILQGAPSGLATVKIGYAINATTAYIRIAESIINA